MDNEEAKFILQAYRPSGSDAGDPMFAPALEQARSDPALGKWFKHEQAFDQIVATSFKRITPPAGLREAILAGGKVSRSPRAWWAQTQWLAMAASLAIAFGLAFTWTLSRRHAEVEQIQAFAIDDVLHGRHGNEGSANARLRAVLENVSVHLSNGDMPAHLAELTSTGCRTLSFGGHEIAEICFTREGQDYHLYVMSRIGDMPSTPRILQRADGAAAAWLDEKNSYVLATRASARDLERIL